MLKKNNQSIMPNQAKSIVNKLEIIKPLVNKENMVKIFKIIKNMSKNKMYQRVFRLALAKNHVKRLQEVIKIMKKQLKPLHAHDMQYVNHNLNDDLRRKNERIDDSNNFIDSRHQFHISKHTFLDDYLKNRSLTLDQIKQLETVEMHPTIKLWAIKKITINDNSYYSAQNLLNDTNTMTNIINVIIEKVRIPYVHYLKNRMQELEHKQSATDSNLGKRIGAMKLKI